MKGVTIHLEISLYILLTETAPIFIAKTDLSGLQCTLRTPKRKESKWSKCGKWVNKSLQDCSEPDLKIIAANDWNLLIVWGLANQWGNIDHLRQL